MVDIKKSGSISREGFIAAMHLIRQRMEGKPLPGRAAEIPKPIEMDLLGPPIATPKGDEKFLVPSLPEPTKVPTASLSPKLTDIFSGMSSFTPANLNANTIEIKNIAERQADLNSRQEEVKNLVEQLQKLQPSVDELREKRDKVDEEFRKATEERNKLTLEISQKRATYESDLATLQDTYTLLQREGQTIQALRVELDQVNHVLKGLQTEKTSMLQKKTDNQSEVAVMKKSIQEITEEANMMRAEVEKIRAELKQQQQIVDVNEKLLNSSRDEYKSVKSSLQQEQERLEIEKRRAIQLQQQADVQSEINRREKEKVMQTEVLKKREIQRSQELLNTIEDISVEQPKPQDPVLRKEEAEKISSEGIVTVVLPNTPAPPAPSTQSKPVKVGESNTQTSVEPTKKFDTKGLSSELDDLMLSNQPKKMATSSKSGPPPVLGSPGSVTSEPMSAKSFGSLPRNSAPFDSPALDAFDAVEEMQKTFTTNPKLAAAKDASSIRSNGSSNILGKSKAFNADAFTFDSSFSSKPNAAPSPFSAAFGSPTVTNASTNGFNNAFSSASTGLKPTKTSSAEDLDAVFGTGGSVSGTKTNNFNAFDDDPFGTGNFSGASSAPKAVGAGDAPEVKRIVEMGFSKGNYFNSEQAVNALEIHGFNQEKALNYLLESVAK